MRSLEILLLLLLPLALCACAIPGSTATPPTVSPVWTPEAPQATSTPVTPEGPYATEEAARQETTVARATASPFPTAGTAAIETRPRVRAVGRRDGLSLTVDMVKNTYLMGEGGIAQIELHNDGPETLFIHGNGHEPAGVILLDEQAGIPDAWPWQDFIRSGPPYLKSFAPGDVLTQTIHFQLPPVEQAKDHQYALWAWTRFSRPAPDNDQGPDNIWLRLETGPIPLTLVSPAPNDQLVASLQTDRSKWQVKVTDAQGRAVQGPLWGLLEMSTENMNCGRYLDEQGNGEMSGAWISSTGDQQALVRGWVAAPNHVTVNFSQTIPGSGDARRMIGPTPEPPLVLKTLAAAQSAAGVALAKPGTLPNGAQLDRVTVKLYRYDGQSLTTTVQYYQLPNEWMELTQMNTTEQWPGSRGGRARGDIEARVVTVNGTSGYLIQQYGWWYLDWQDGDAGFELQAPVDVLSKNELIAIAQTIK